jgi:pimeloyl-ACP methyl ester carboxylesterase
MPFVTSGGSRIAYTRVGSGPAVLLIQGVGAIGRVWEPQVEALAPRFTAVHFDNRGIGESTSDGRALSIEAMASDALAVMDAEQIDRFHVAGHSMGGAIAQALALAVPERVLSLSLLCTFAAGGDAVKLSWGMMWSGIRSRVGSRAARRRAFLEMVVPPAELSAHGVDAMHERLAPLFGRDLADQPPIAMKQLRALSRYDARERLGTLSGMPTLVMSGELDRIARPESGRGLAAAIPGARYLELPGAGHAVPVYRPDAVNGPLLEHLAG